MLGYMEVLRVESLIPAYKECLYNIITDFNKSRFISKKIKIEDYLYLDFLTEYLDKFE